MPSHVEDALRQLIMDAVARRAAEKGGWVTRADLSELVLADGTVQRVIAHSKGIWNPRNLAATLSVVSSPDGPYADREVQGGLFHYSYCSGSTDGDNKKLRRAYELGTPIILLRKIDTAVFVPVFPVYVVHDDLRNREFVLALDESIRVLGRPESMTADQRRYAERVVQVRLHQPEFRGRIIRAYDTRCAICELRHADLLDAAHIVADAQSHGTPVVTNGMSLCKIHHAAYDRNLMGVSPDYEVKVDRELLEEIDGPMLKHGIQEMDGRKIVLPQLAKNRPDRDRLAERFAQFQAKSA